MALTDLKSRIEDSVSPNFNSESSYTADMNQDDTIDIVDLSVLNKTILKK